MSAKNDQTDFRDISELDAVTLVANTATVAANSGHNVMVSNATRRGERGILVWMPGYLHDGESIRPAPPAIEQ